MLKKILRGLIVLSAAAATSVFAGPLSLQSATVSGTYSAGTLQPGATQTVDPFNAEFLTEDTNLNQYFFVDFDTAGLISIFNALSNWTSPANQILTFSLAGLSENIIGATNSGLALSVLTPSSIQIDLSNTVWGDQFSSMSAQLVFADTSSVPEPGTLALLGVSMIALCGRRRLTTTSKI